MFRRKIVFFPRFFQCFLETAQPDLARGFVDFKWEMSGPHAGRAMVDDIKGWPAEDLDKKLGRLLGSFLHVGREEGTYRGLFQFFIKIRHHLEDVFLAHQRINLTAWPRAWRRAAGRRVDR